jgi:lysosomal acid lipase/cholesteryl ester hydrolase
MKNQESQYYKFSFRSEKKIPVYFQHGLFDSSDGFICNYERNCLPFIMLKRGFDVWIGNSRGNKYSKYAEIRAGKDATTFSADKKFWDYSFHDMGLYDIPANIDQILKINCSGEKIIYFGHSQGGAAILAGMSENIDYFKQYLRTVVLLAPASRIDRYDSSVLNLLREIQLDEKLESRGIYEVLPHNPDMNSFSVKISRIYPTFHYAMLEMCSDEVSWMNCPERIKVYMAHYPSGSSLKSLIHFKQLIDAKQFQKFDYGEEENLKLYGSAKAPKYNLENIQDIPIILCGGLNDKLTHIEDIRWLREEIKSTLFRYHEFDHMGHASFLINNDITWFNFVLRDIYQIIHNERDINSKIKIEEKKESDNLKTIEINHISEKNSYQNLNENQNNNKIEIKEYTESEEFENVTITNVVNVVNTQTIIINHKTNSSIDINSNSISINETSKTQQTYEAKY